MGSFGSAGGIGFVLQRGATPLFSFAHRKIGFVFSAWPGSGVEGQPPRGVHRRSFGAAAPGPKPPATRANGNFIVMWFRSRWVRSVQPDNA